MNRLLDTRIADSEEGLQRITKAAERAQTRRNQAHDLHNGLKTLFFPKQYFTPLQILVNGAAEVASDRDLLPEHIGQTLLADTEKARKALSELQDDLRELRRQAKELEESSLDPEQLDYFIEQTKSVVAKKRETLQAVSTNALKKKPADLLADLKRDQPPWAEHIETIAGMLLRDEKFDDGLSRLADRVVDICRKQVFGMKTVNLLGREQTGLKELSWAVFVRFPAWNVWALPLIAHDFWHCVSRYALEKPGVAARLSTMKGWQSGWEDPLIQDCLADAFGTLVIGPAYPLACVLLALDVNLPHDQLRAQVIFTMIDALKKKNTAYVFDPDLQSCWNEAGQNITGTVDPVQTPCTPSASPTPVACCPEPNSDAFKEWLALMRELLPPSLCYSSDNWTAVSTPLLDLLRAVENDDSWMELLGKFEWKDKENADIRNVLHAAWLLRWESPAENAKAVERLARRTKDVCDKIPVKELAKTDTAGWTGPVARQAGGSWR